MNRESDDKAQFSELMEAYAGPIRRLCAAYAVSADRDDLFQDIFLAVWRALPASLPVKRATIFCLKARENGFVTELLPSRPAD